MKCDVFRLAMMSIFCVTFLAGCGDQFAEQGRFLTQEINNHLLNSDFCKDVDACQRKLSIHGKYGSQVNLDIYGIDDRRALAKLAEFIVAHGVEVAGGVPVVVKVYSQPAIAYAKQFFSFKKTVLEIEVK